MITAICDDEPIFLEALEKQLKENGRIHAVRKYSDLDMLYNHILNQERYDLIFMDIDWKERKENGIEFISSINRKCPTTQVIYVTAYNDRFSQRIFWEPSNLCGLLVKPVNSEHLFRLVEKAYDTMQKMETEKLIVQQRGSIFALPYHSILYVESAGHQLMIHGEDENICVYEKLDLFGKKLPEEFVHCHKSYLVNMHAIRRLGNKEILLKNGISIPVSKSRYARTREKYFRYMGGSL